MQIHLQVGGEVHQRLLLLLVVFSVRAGAIVIVM
jgi:hypothetical protein